MAITPSNDKDFKSQIESNPKVVVKYYADWCGSCKLFTPKYRRISEAAENKDILFLDINAEENPEARKFANVDNLPFFAVIKDGQLIEGTATSREEYLNEMINKIR
jgi:thioredoxin 1